jgi:hypothetical protein
MSALNCRRALSKSDGKASKSERRALSALWPGWVLIQSNLGCCVSMCAKPGGVGRRHRRILRPAALASSRVTLLLSDWLTPPSTDLAAVLPQNLHVERQVDTVLRSDADLERMSGSQQPAHTYGLMSRQEDAFFPLVLGYSGLVF